MSERVTIKHPDQGEDAATREVSREAFELTWKAKGFKEVPPDEIGAEVNPGAALQAARAAANRQTAEPDTGDEGDEGDEGVVEPDTDAEVDLDTDAEVDLDTDAEPDVPPFGRN